MSLLAVDSTSWFTWTMVPFVPIASSYIAFGLTVCNIFSVTDYLLHCVRSLWSVKKREIRALFVMMIWPIDVMISFYCKLLELKNHLWLNC